MNPIIALVVGWLIERVQLVICAHNYDSVYNGFGAIDTTNSRTTLAPMQYRVLVPWLIALIEKISGENPKRRLVIYEVIKTLLTAGAIYSVSLAWNQDVALLTAVMILATFRYEYWDWGPELIGFALTMTGNIQMAIIGVILHGLSRETVVILPVLFLLKTGDIAYSLILGVLAIAVVMIPRIWGGKKKLYCSRFNSQLSQNWEMFTSVFKWNPFFLSEIFISLAIVALSIAMVITTQPVGWPVVLIMVAAAITMNFIDETRPFGAVFPWIAAWLLGAK